MAEDLVISLNLDDSKISPKIKKLQADFDVATAKIRKQQQAIQDMQKELAYWNNEMAKSGKGVSKTMMAEKIDPLNQKIEEANIKLKQMQAAAEVTGQKLDSAMGNGSDKASRMSKAVSKAGNAFKDFGKRLVSVAKSALIFTVLYSAFNKLRQMFSGYLKSNAKFADSLALIKGNLLTAFQAIYDKALPAINSLMSALVKATAYVSYFFNALAGKDITNAAQAAEDLYEQANATEQVTEATEKANKALASFDELNTVDVGKETVTGNSSSESNTKPDFGFDYSTINTEFIDNVVEKIKGIVDALKTAWNWIEKNLGGFNGILSIAGAIGTAILGWKIGTKVYNFFSNLGTNGGKIAAALAGVTIAITGFKFLYDTVYDATLNGNTNSDAFWIAAGEALAGILGCTFTGLIIGSAVGGLVGALAGAAIGLAIGSVITAVTVVKAKMDAEEQKRYDDLYKTELGQWIKELEKNVESSYAIAVKVQTDIELAKGKIDDVTEAYKNANELLNEIYRLNDKENRTSGEQLLLEGLIDEFNNLDITEITLNVDTKQVEQAYEKVKELTTQWYELAEAEANKEYLVTLYKKQKELEAQIEQNNSDIDDAIQTYRDNQQRIYELQTIEWNGGTLTDAQEQELQNLQTANKKLNNLNSLNNGIIVQLQNTNKELFELLDNVNNGIEEIIGTTQNIPDDLFDPYTKSIENAKKAIDDLSDSIDKLQSKKYIKVAFGDTTISSGISRMIPALARGAVLPANKPFLALVGDQSSGTNVEAPLSTIKQAVREVLGENGSSYGNDITIPVYIDGDKVDEAVVRRQDIRNKMRGLALT